MRYIYCQPEQLRSIEHIARHLNTDPDPDRILEIGLLQCTKGLDQNVTLDFSTRQERSGEVRRGQERSGETSYMTRVCKEDV